MRKVLIKTEEEMSIMAEGGAKLAYVRDELAKAVKPGLSSWDIDHLADELIESVGAYPSFKKVPRYSWSTCINVNSGIVHGIPKKSVIFKEGDMVSVDVGVFYKGFHTDTAVSVYLGNDPEIKHFWQIGQKSLNDGIKQAQNGNLIGQISAAVENTLVSNNYYPVKELTGHGVGRDLHEAPYIPCFVSNSDEEKVEIKTGFVLAIEVMYTIGKADITYDPDGWTIRTKNGKIAALFEETVAVTSKGTKILTSASKL